MNTDWHLSKNEALRTARKRLEGGLIVACQGRAQGARYATILYLLTTGGEEGKDGTPPATSRSERCAAATRAEEGNMGGGRPCAARLPATSPLQCPSISPLRTEVKTAKKGRGLNNAAVRQNCEEEVHAAKFELPLSSSHGEVSNIISQHLFDSPTWCVRPHPRPSLGETPARTATSEA